MNKSSLDDADTWTQRACFAGGCITIFISLAKSISLTYINSTGTDQIWSWVAFTFAAFLGYIMSDLGSGIYHWVLDNYGSPQTPILGSQMESFQLHHLQPLAFTTRKLATKLYIQGVAVTIIFMPVNLLCSDPVLLSFVCAFSGFIMFSQQFHSWAHVPKGKLPLMVVVLQDIGVLVDRNHHATHHRSPYNKSYCIVNGVWNRILDRFGFYLGLEWIVFSMIGVRPRSWAGPGASDGLNQANS